MCGGSCSRGVPTTLTTHAISSLSSSGPFLTIYSMNETVERASQSSPEPAHTKKAQRAPRCVDAADRTMGDTKHTAEQGPLFQSQDLCPYMSVSLVQGAFCQSQKSMSRRLRNTLATNTRAATSSNASPGTSSSLSSNQSNTEKESESSGAILQSHETDASFASLCQSGNGTRALPTTQKTAGTEDASKHDVPHAPKMRTDEVHQEECQGDDEDEEVREMAMAREMLQ